MYARVGVGVLETGASITVGRWSKRSASERYPTRRMNANPTSSHLHPFPNIGLSEVVSITSPSRRADCALLLRCQIEPVRRIKGRCRANEGKVNSIPTLD